MKTKEKILRQTIDLLNENGISNVTMRDVATALDISLGNLTYHYPKWENLMESIFKEFSGELLDVTNSFFPKEITEIVTWLNKIYEIQIKYSFIFSNFYVFYKTYPKYEGMIKNFINSRIWYTRGALEVLVHADLLYPADDDHDYDLLVKNLWMVFAGWTSFAKILPQIDSRDDHYGFLTTIWNLFAFHLTEKGRKIIKQIYYHEIGNFIEGKV